MRWAALLLVSTGGCSLFLGGDDNKAPDTTDGSVVVTPDAATCGSVMTRDIQTEADAELDDVNVDQNHESDPGMSLRGQDHGSRTNIAVRFKPGELAAQDIVAMSITLTPMLDFLGCGSTGDCASCLGNFAGGDADVRFLTNDWLESEATWNKPSPNNTWNPDNLGALASDVIGSGSFSPTDPLVLELDPLLVRDEVESWLADGELSVMLQPATPNLRIMLATIDNDERCDDGADYAPAKLTVSVCTDTD